MCYENFDPATKKNCTQCHSYPRDWIDQNGTEKRLELRIVETEGWNVSDYKDQVRELAFGNLERGPLIYCATTQEGVIMDTVASICHVWLPDISQ